MNTLQELIAERDSLARKIAEARRSARSEAISKILSIMAECGLTIADLGIHSAEEKLRNNHMPKKVAVKYRDPVLGHEWTGRGLKPKWLRAALASGKSLNDFSVS